jgi:hypothetical protein
MSPAPGVAVRALDTPDDWQAWRPDVEALEALAAPCPWAGWAYWHACAGHLGHQGCLGLEARDAGGRLLAAGVVRCQDERRGQLPLRTLRAFDQVSFMRVPPFLARPGCEAEAARAMAEAYRLAAARMRADLVTLFRLDASGALPLGDAVEARGAVVRRSTWTRAAVLLPPDDLLAHLKGRRANLLHNIRRTRRKLAREHGAEPRLETLGPDTLAPDAWQAACDRFDALEQRTWQHAWEQQSERVDLARTRAFEAACRDLWRAHGWLRLHLLTLPGADGAPRDLALALTLSLPDRTWILRLGFDPAWQVYGPGRLLLHDLLVAEHARGVRRLELGGEVIGWKVHWADAFEDVRRLEWGGPTWKGRLWSLGERLRPTTPTPVGGPTPGATDDDGSDAT